MKSQNTKFSKFGSQGIKSHLVGRYVDVDINIGTDIGTEISADRELVRILKAEKIQMLSTRQNYSGKREERKEFDIFPCTNRCCFKKTREYQEMNFS